MKSLKSVSFMITACMIISLSGCASVNREVGQLNFDYKPTTETAKDKKLIALVSPEVLKVQSQQNQTPNVGPNLAAILGGSVNYNSTFFNFGDYYRHNYESRLITSMTNGFQEMLNQKSFNLSGPYSTFDDMSYSDKKKAYLALVPTLNIQISDRPDCSSSRIKGVMTNNGIISVTGEMTVNLFEPMTKERIMSKRINLSDLDIRKPYTIQTKMASSGHILLDLILLPFQTTTLTDNSDKALAEALNEFYAKAMPKIDKMITNEELASYEKAVAELKGLKRY